MTNIFNRNFSNALTIVVVVASSVWATLSLGRAVSHVFQPYAGVDFHSYWYSGHFVRQGSDPYAAFFEGRQPQVPVRYLDGYVASTLPIAQPQLAVVPANTAPIVLVMTLLSYFSWPTAKILWLICNLSFMLVIPWMAIKLWPDKAAIGINRNSLLIALSFWMLLATRFAVVSGQTTLLLFTLMLLALIVVDKNWILSGLALGLALSKYSLSLPIVLFMLFTKKYRVVIVSLLVQLLGLAILCYVSGASPPQVLTSYFRMLILHTDLPGINLSSSLSPLVSSNGLGFIPILLIGLVSTLITAIPVIHWVRCYYSGLSAFNKQLGEFHILNILLLWGLLVVYHREYDVVTWVVFLVLLVYGIADNVWRLSESARNSLKLFAALSIVWLSRPGEIVVDFLLPELTEMWKQLAMRAVTLIITSCLALAIVLLYHLSSQNHKSVFAGRASSLEGVR